MKSLRTHVKREAQRLARQVSVEFDSACEGALRATQELCTQHDELTAGPYEEAIHPPGSSPQDILARLPKQVRLAAHRVIEEQQNNPSGWRERVMRWRDVYESQIDRPMGYPGPAIGAEAKAYVRGIDAVLNAESIPELVRGSAHGAILPTNEGQAQFESWEALRREALALYKHEVSEARYKVAERVLSKLRVSGTSARDIQDALQAHSLEHLKRVQPRTVKGQQDAALSALRKVLTDLRPRPIRELKGVMQPRVGDKESMPVQSIRAALAALAERPRSSKVRKGYDGGASQFDCIVVQMLAYTGMRPAELFGANQAALAQKQDFRGVSGLYFRIQNGKNKSSERDIPLSDGVRSAVDVDALRELLVWLGQNIRSVRGLVTSLNTRFKKITRGYTLYQMRHSWKDVAQHVGIDFEIRERILGHNVQGVAAIYGSGIPLEGGLDALMCVRAEIEGR
ncbi:hypothetical protein GPA27_06485 [Aromatoleum toluolicum]|uniref:Integrase n=2 Tax=Aromatoleum toluolicum TaxID=90060 RepID=A0ABX1NCU4_9RHOO|nr:hypothetical protein [Aromatoleum toluolicum]